MFIKRMFSDDISMIEFFRSEIIKSLATTKDHASQIINILENYKSSDNKADAHGSKLFTTTLILFIRDLNKAEILLSRDITIILKGDNNENRND